MKIYEDNASGKLNDNRYEMLSQSYEAEQNQLETEVIDLKREIEEQGDQKRHIDQYIAKAKKYAGVKELDGYILHEFIKAIYVEAPDKSSGHRVQNIHIEYNGIGFLPIGMLMERETHGVTESRKLENIGFQLGFVPVFLQYCFIGAGLRLSRFGGWMVFICRR